jgi:hypothetical protein
MLNILGFTLTPPCRQACGEAKARWPGLARGPRICSRCNAHSSTRVVGGEI